MPPPAVKTICDLIYWEYAKLVAGSAVNDRKNYAFVMCTYQEFKSGKKKPSDILRENKLLINEYSKNCAYCGSAENLQWEHIIPISRGGPDTIDNQVLACQKCNCSKGDKDPYEWYGEKRKYEIPRLIWGKYLKIIYDMHKEKGTLDKECSKTLDLSCVLLPSKEMK